MTEEEYEALYEALEAAHKILPGAKDCDEKDAELRKKIRKLEKAVLKTSEASCESRRKEEGITCPLGGLGRRNRLHAALRELRDYEGFLHFSSEPRTLWLGADHKLPVLRRRAACGPEDRPADLQAWARHWHRQR